MVIGIAAFLLYRRKKSNNNIKQEQAAQDANDHEERLSVDWDAIEGGFVETNLPLNSNNRNMIPYNGTVNNNSNIVLENSNLYSSANEFGHGEKSPVVDYNNSQFEVASQAATSVTAVSPPLVNLSTTGSPLNDGTRQSYPPDISRHEEHTTTYLTKPDGA